MKKIALLLMASLVAYATTFGQDDQVDTLKATVFSAKSQSNFIKRSTSLRTESITAAGLCKMACCNLAESFENSASVTVGYSDAVSGARQIRLLGQSGIYTQMLDENRPVMRGLSAPFGLDFVPGQWLESIQIAKGVGSVINGVEAMTGQIDLEHRKPTDEKPFYVQASIMNDTKADLNVVSSLQLDEMMKWNTVIFGHVSGNFKQFDHNGDNFWDDPKNIQASLGNRWLYSSLSGVQVRFGVNGVYDKRGGGQVKASEGKDIWKSDIVNKHLDAYLKVGVPLGDNQANSVALVAGYTYHNMDAKYGIRSYIGKQHSVFANLMWQQEITDYHKITVGISEMADFLNESFQSVSKLDKVVRFNDFGVYGEYTFHAGEVLTAVVGARADNYGSNGWKATPRVTLKFSPVEPLVLRGNFGRGIRMTMPVADNMGFLANSKSFVFDKLLSHQLEDSWTYGGNLTWYIGNSSSTFLSFDYFGTRFNDKLMYENNSDKIFIYSLQDLAGKGRCFTNNYQLDFNAEPFKGFTTTLTFRYTDARQSFLDGTVSETPMTSRYKGVLNLQYTTNLSKWIFDFTASLNGPCKVWDFMKQYYPDGRTAVYPLLYAQVTRRFKGIDVYLGGENLTNYKQANPIVSASDPWSSKFDASCVWGPLMGIRVYAGVRVTIWKTY